MADYKGKRIQKKKLFKVSKAVVDNFKGTVMVDLYDKDYNRLYIHIHKNGEMMLEVFYLKDRLMGFTSTPTTEIKTIFDVIKEVKNNMGIEIVYTAEKEGRQL